MALLHLLPLFLLAAGLLSIAWTVFIYRGLTRPPRRAAGWALAHGLPLDPGGLGLPFTELRFQLPDGQSAPAWLVIGRAASAPILIVCHGWAGSRYVMLKRLPLWSKIFSAILLYDLRGHGDAPRGVFHGGVVEADDLHAIFQQLPAHLPQPAPIVLLGLSTGASIAMLAASRGDLSPQPLALIAEGVFRHRLTPIAGFLRQRRWPAWPFVNLVGLYLRLFPEKFGPLDRLTLADNLPCPALLIHGQFDALCPLAHAQQLAHRSPTIRCVVFPNAHHVDMADLHPQTYHDTLAAFFQRLGLSIPLPPTSDP